MAMIKFFANRCARILIPAAGLVMTSCSPIFTIENDSGKTIYADILPPGVQRALSAQPIKAGDRLSTPGCWDHVGTLYVGPDPAKLEARPYAALCKPTKCFCTVTVSQLESATRYQIHGTSR